MRGKMITDRGYCVIAIAAIAVILTVFLNLPEFWLQF